MSSIKLSATLCVAIQQHVDVDAVPRKIQTSTIHRPHVAGLRARSHHLAASKAMVQFLSLSKMMKEMVMSHETKRCAGK